jgi:hypothetical protein
MPSPPRRACGGLMARARVVHSTGRVVRSSGNDTDCGATGDADKLLVSVVDARVTCKRCLRARHAEERRILLNPKRYGR